MTYTAIDTFYPPAERLRDSPSRRDGVDEPAEASLRASVVMNTGQVLLQSSTASTASSRSPGSASRESPATCAWLSTKLEESPRGLESVIRVFHRIECRRHGAPTRHLRDSSLDFSHGSLEAGETRAQGIGGRLPC